MPQPMSKPRARAAAAADDKTAAGPERRVAVTVRSLREPPLDVRLPPQAPTTSVLDVRAAVAAQTGIPLAKLRLLHAKKPAADSKALRDLLPPGGGGAAIEFSVMIMGGAATLVAAQAAGADDKAAAQQGPAVAQGLSGEGVLETEEFWGDLKGFLQQRTRDEGVAEEAVKKFKEAWAGRS